jgi:hypothetical protein
MNGILHKISDSLSKLDGSHALVKVVENHITATSAHTGTGHFKINIGDCFVEGDYGDSKAGDVQSAMSSQQFVNIHSGFNTPDTNAACKDWADFLTKALTEKIGQVLDK